ncbi:MAG: RagB/SusD family nutrient uptake outer membrane protein [Prevotella sp.]|nr:RagB/SusD family nutrient uptake outer membrane protein [Prevotella sp.]
MITKIYNIIRTGFLFCAIGAFTLTSCEDELDIAKHGNLGSMDDFYTTDDNVMQATASLYTETRGLYFNWFFTKNLLSDDIWCGGGSRGDNAGMEMLNEYTFGTDHSMIEGLYSGLYGVIYKANLIIDKTQGDSPVMKRAINEAKVFRAWASFELVTLWGTAPVVDHLLQPNEYRQANGDPAAMWALIESDLTEAINSGTLPSKSDANDAETGIRITKETAQAFLGKAYLFQGKNSEAAAMLDNVIKSGKYALFNGDYDLQFHAPYNNNCESLFELQKRYDTEQMWSQMDMVFIMQGWRTSVLNYGGQAASVLAQGTYGFCNPRKSLYDAFVAWEGANGYRLNKTVLTYDQVADFGVSLQTGQFLYGSEGYFFWKNQAFKEDCVSDMSFFQAAQYTDLKVMRYAEVLLLAAEAHLQAGNNSKALEYINMIRTRAQETPLSNVTLNDIKTEKRLELCNEAVRYQDLVRWGDAQTAMADQGKEIPVLTTTGVQWNFRNDNYGFKEKNKLLPIPLKEIELNPNMTQNPNW